MKLARIETDQGIAYAQVEEAGYRVVDGDIFGTWEMSGRTVPTEAARLLAPVQPRQIVAIGLNYRGHAKESGMEPPPAPLLFVKTPNAIVGPGDPILLPSMAPDEVDYEAELVLVIGKECKNVSEAEAPDYILGYTCGNDVSARDCQLRFDKQWARGKCFDTFAPVGPWITTDLDGDNLGIRLTLNGETMQDSNTSDLIFSCIQLVSYISQCMTLFAGSIIMTGTPSGVGMGRKPPVWLRNGDSVTVEIEGIGQLTNPVQLEVGS
jgi:2-keto-4-pentenoate hydratase/2-oxohepta-3-ene-1,7-dioic acid hydratase in catechol pathway